ncbi:hypothetical protein ACFU5O_09830 [Streptomyces sp. NPDC057445]|uniref:hypothetical protein n=1 Tax=Streptomyces sp. NPDC057445 TaxID=3346136 RepID=UPI00369439C2
MPDRRRRAALRLPLVRERGSLLLRERRSTGPSEPARPTGPTRPADDSNPFAPPPEGSPDRPWQPRHSTGDGDEDGRQGEQPEDERPEEDRPSSGWGSQWSSRQPGRSPGGFGGRPGGQNSQGGGGEGGPEGGDGQGAGLRWDPTDPAQRRARYALLSGMWAFFFALFDLPEVALLLGALALYWGGSSLRAKSRRPGQGAATAPAAAPAQPGGGRTQVTAAVSGMVMAVIALAIVAMTFTMQFVYSDFYTCRDDALTKSGQLACNDLLPHPLRELIGVKE